MSYDEFYQNVADIPEEELKSLATMDENTLSMDRLPGCLPALAQNVLDQRAANKALNYEMLRQRRINPEQWVKDTLKQLSEHFHDPVMPLSQFCTTMKKWARCVEDANEEAWKEFKARLPDATPDMMTHHGNSYYQHISHILTDIAKSDLLGRMFYAGEEPRTVKCPEHKGHWSGIEWDDPVRGDKNVCPHGCGLSGWLPNKET